MTVTLMPLGHMLVVEHWSSRVVVGLHPTDDDETTRRALIEPMHGITQATHTRLAALVDADMYGRGAPSGIEVPVQDAEFVFNRAVPGRPDPQDRVTVDLPPLERSARARAPRSSVTSKPVPLVMRRHVSSAVLDDLERATILATIHFKLVAAGHGHLALRAASADYAREIIVTDSGQSGSAQWWADAATRCGVSVPPIRKIAARFNHHGQVVLSNRRKQVR